jgi:hypothetical protein
MDGKTKNARDLKKIDFFKGNAIHMLNITVKYDTYDCCSDAFAYLVKGGAKDEQQRNICQS